MEAENVEVRPTWKPMHLQPVYERAPSVITGVADRVFQTGVCLPSGSNLEPADQDRVIGVVRDILGR